MTLFKNKYRIESIRLKGYDYSTDGYYFVTICTFNNESLLGKIEEGKMALNRFGIIVEQCWNDLSNHYSNIVLDDFVFMPNHFHGIVIIDNKRLLQRNTKNTFVEMGLKPISTNSENKIQHGLSEFIRALKTFSSRRINEIRGTIGTPVWQSGFYDHIIHGDDELNLVRQYISENPENWGKDELYP
jgi:putative transposase